MKKDRNYGRFYLLFNRLEGATEEVKQNLVFQYTHGRTTHISQTTLKEYNALCRDLAEAIEGKDKLRRGRSRVLRQMQKMGVDTTDWKRVDLLSEHPRIMGKPFRYCSVKELNLMFRRLKAIERKEGGLRMKEKETTEKDVLSVRIINEHLVNTKDLN